MRFLILIVCLTACFCSQAKVKPSPEGPLETTPLAEAKKGPFQILSKEQRTALSRITSKGFIVGQKTLKNGRKELTWTNGKDTVVTTQKVERILAKKSPDPRRAEIAAAKAERDTAKADRAAFKAERDALKTENDKLKKEKAK